MCWIVSYSFPHLLHSSSVSGYFKIYFLQLLVSMTWSCIAVKKPSFSANKSAFVSHLFDASMSTYCWLRSYGWRPCKDFWDHCLLTLLLYSSCGELICIARTKSSGVHLSSHYYLLQLSFHSVSVVLTLVTNKNKYT